MPGLEELITVLEETRRLLALPDNNFDWSSWVDREDALDEIDRHLSSLRSGILPSDLNMHVLYAPTGPIQEVSLSGGWASEFIELANRFEDAVASEKLEEHQDSRSLESCRCFAGQLDQLLLAKDLGLDSWFAEVSVLVCADCGQHWLRYFYEAEAFTRSGRWYLGAISAELLTAISVEHAKEMLEGLQWYFYGGSYYEGRSGKTSGEIMLNP